MTNRSTALRFDPLICEWKPKDLADEIEGSYKLLVEVSTGRAPHGSPPGCLEVMIAHPPLPDGRPGGVTSNRSILEFFHRFGTKKDLGQIAHDLDVAEADLAKAKRENKQLRREVARLEDALRNPGSQEATKP